MMPLFFNINWRVIVKKLSKNYINNLFHIKKYEKYFFLSLLLLSAATEAVAQGTTSGVGTKLTGAATELGNIINATTTVIVTVAIIFSGYQISFNNKRFGEVWPILLGGLMVGAAGVFANFFIAGK